MQNECITATLLCKDLYRHIKKGKAMKKKQLNPGQIW